MVGGNVSSQDEGIVYANRCASLRIYARLGAMAGMLYGTNRAPADLTQCLRGGDLIRNDSLIQESAPHTCTRKSSINPKRNLSNGRATLR
jgi:hypothetical protein